MYNRLHCPKCDANFGQEVRLLRHLTDVHDIADHLVFYVETHCNDIHPTCSCSSECDVKLHWLGWKKGFVSKYARGHNACVDSVYLNKKRQQEFVAKRIEGYESGRLKVWNDGLTKETDERVATASEKISNTLNEGYASGRIVDWHVLDPEKALIANEKSSETKKRKYASGETKSWNDGLTKKTSPTLEAMSKKISESLGRNPYTAAAIKRFKPDELEAMIFDAAGSIFETITDLNTYRNKRHRMQFRCKTCNCIQEKTIKMLLNAPMCFTCHPRESFAQLEMYEFVKSIAPDALLSDRKAITPKELDIYAPGKRLGIEYDGLYWHSELHKDNDYASYKLSLCKSAGVSFMGIFEDEWRDKRPIVESLIRHRLGVFDDRIGARECIVEEVGVPERRAFMNAHHLDGDAVSSVAFCLRKGDIIAAMSLRKPFHKSKHEGVYEVARFCTLPNVSVPGALSRLTKHALAWAKSQGAVGLLTYVDQRIGVGHGYINAGFSSSHVTKPRFWWTDFVHRYDRFSTKADSERGMTQAEVAAEKGVVMIHGCPNVVLRCSV